jgi:hypothetical protein
VVGREKVALVPGDDLAPDVGELRAVAEDVLRDLLPEQDDQPRVEQRHLDGEKPLTRADLVGAGRPVVSGEALHEIRDDHVGLTREPCHGKPCVQ